MIQSGSSRSEHPWRARRRYARAPIDGTPVEIHTKSTVGRPVIGRIDNLSVGGVLAACRETFDVSTELAMLFHLPTGFPIHAFGRVIYAMPERHFGVAFLDLDREARLQVEEFIQKVLGYTRRSSRVPYRTHLTIRSSEGAGSDGEPESADTVLVSRNGGLLVSRATYNEGQKIYLWSPAEQRGTHARVVFHRLWIADGLVELGFEFLTDENFWAIDFPDEQD